MQACDCPETACLHFAVANLTKLFCADVAQSYYLIALYNAICKLLGAETAKRQEPIVLKPLPQHKKKFYDVQ